MSNENYYDGYSYEDWYGESAYDEPDFVDDEPSDGFRDDVDADANALAGAGYGTDEDYYSEPYDSDLYGEC